MLEEIKILLTDLENDRVERTISTTNTDKFGQAICAFANDLPGCGLAGYLLLGVKDDGSVLGLDVTDELLKNIAAIRTDGNIQPQPSMVVEKVSLEDKDIVVVKVEPSIFPPVRYKGRIWVRVGPRKAIANEADEHILLERRASSVRTFDSSPCLDATIYDLDLSVFKHVYLPKAIPDEVVDVDKRDVKEQLQALGFYDLNFNCPTYAGILFFGKNVERFLGGAYVQYVRFKGKGRAGEIMREHKFSGNLCKILPELDTFINATIANRRPIPVSAAREENVVDYPYWATRELLMNAICHRDYTGNGPIQFYQYDDRIEILNPGGLYGKANPINFPRVNDYRNIVVAEGMKVLGFVNRFSRGILQVQEQLVENGNGVPEFDLNLITAFLAIEKISNVGLELERKAIELGFLIDKGMKENESKTLISGQKPSEMKENESKTFISGQKPSFPTDLYKNVHLAIVHNPKIKYSQLADNLGISEASIYRAINWLKENGYINSERSKIKGVWQIEK